MTRRPFYRSRCLGAACALLLTPAAAVALNPALDASQYAHASWRVRDGFWAGTLTAIAQTPDGYLWVGTSAGLFRFDGIRGMPWQPPADDPLPSQMIVSLTTGRDGTLWIATTKGLVSWRDGKLEKYSDLAGDFIWQILEARDGVIWVTVARPRTRVWTLCAIERGSTRCFGADGGPGANVMGLYEDRRGTLWASTADGIWEWGPGPRQFHQLSPQPNGIQGIAESDEGSLLMPMLGGVWRLRDGRPELTYPFPPGMRGVSSNAVLRDRHGALWIGTASMGIVHIHQGITDVFTQKDGLSGDAISRIFEDREANVWVVSRHGLDRFRDVAAATVSARQGLSNPVVSSLLAATDRSIWLGTANGLNRFDGNQVTVYGTRPNETSSGTPGSDSRVVREITGPAVPGGGIGPLLQDRRGRIWLGTRQGVHYLERDRWVQVRGVPGGITRGMAEDHTGVWVVNQDLGLYHISPAGQVLQHIAWTALNRARPPLAVTAQPTEAGLWIGFTEGEVINVVDGRIRQSFSSSDGLAEGIVHGLRIDRDGTLWTLSDGGLRRFKDGRVTSLSRKNGLPCDVAQWLIEDAQAFWLGMSCGVVRIARSDISAWMTIVDRDPAAAPAVHAMVFGTADGARLYPDASYFTAPAVMVADGRLWFLSQDGVSVLDPRYLPSNPLPPPVHVEQIVADHKTYDTSIHDDRRLRFPALTRDLQIDYTALSLVAPEKMRFRYKLEGHDRDWQDAGTRRQAFYTDLAPRSYRFRVIASNNDGVWNEAGATIAFAIAPAYYQTNWFIVLSAGLVVGLAWAAHRIRLRIVKRHQVEITALNERLMKAQEQERIRIAGELHDGVMQRMLAATMMLGTAKRRIGDNPEAAATIDKVQDTLIQTGTEIRQLSHDLHPPALQEAGLPQAVRAYCEEFSAACGIAVSCEADDSVHELSRGAALALFRIMQEALGNAAKHGAAKSITVRLTRANGSVALVVTDDGAGFDGSRLGTSGGLGLIMMRERATQLNGKFEFESMPGRGTSIRVSIPFR